MVESTDRFQERAVGMLTSDRAKRAFDLSLESPMVRDRYGRHCWGQRALMARRLVEAGVSFVTLIMENPYQSGVEQLKQGVYNWDSHAVNCNLFTDTKHKLGHLDKAPTRSLGQNFLHDQNLAAWIVDQLALKEGEPWVELGPGLGALTEFAVAKSANGLVIEKDGKLANHLLVRFPGLEVVHGDATEFDVRLLFPRGPVKLFGNLPYYVSSQILFHYTADPSPVSSFVFTLQRELAARLSAEPRTDRKSVV